MPSRDHSIVFFTLPFTSLTISITLSAAIDHVNMKPASPTLPTPPSRSEASHASDVTRTISHLSRISDLPKTLSSTSRVSLVGGTSAVDTLALPDGTTHTTYLMANGVIVRTLLQGKTLLGKGKAILEV